MRLLLVREDDRPGRGGSGWADHIEYCIGCEICEIAVRLSDESAELGASLSYQVLQRSHRDRERNIDNSFLGYDKDVNFAFRRCGY